MDSTSGRLRMQCSMMHVCLRRRSKSKDENNDPEEIPKRLLRTADPPKEAGRPVSRAPTPSGKTSCSRAVPGHAGTQTLGSGVSSPQPATPPPFWQLTRHWAYVGLGQSRLPEAGRGLGATLTPRSRPGPTVCTKASLQAYDPP